MKAGKQGTVFPYSILTIEVPAVLSLVASLLLKDRPPAAAPCADAVGLTGGGRVGKWKDGNVSPRLFASDQQRSPSIGLSWSPPAQVSWRCSRVSAGGS